MNQNILIRLEKQAEKLVLDIPASLDCDEYTPLFNEKFAELIVRECAEICLEANDHKNILRHFGVEHAN
jgi:hypothetical protein